MTRWAALQFVVGAINALLTVDGQHYRVSPDDVIVTRRNGYTFIALKETRDAADWRQCAPPYSTMNAE